MLTDRVEVRSLSSEDHPHCPSSLRAELLIQVSHRLRCRNCAAGPMHTLPAWWGPLSAEIFFGPDTLLSLHPDELAWALRPKSLFIQAVFIKHLPDVMLASHLPSSLGPCNTSLYCLLALPAHNFWPHSKPQESCVKLSTPKITLRS